MEINLICDYQLRPEYRRRLRANNRAVYLSADDSFGNVFLGAEALSRDLGRRLDPLSLELCEIAAYVYLGDKAVSRGRYEKWTRNLSFLVPVRNPDRWNSVKEILTNTIATLSGDNIQFDFVPKANGEENKTPYSRSNPPSFP